VARAYKSTVLFNTGSRVYRVEITDLIVGDVVSFDGSDDVILILFFNSVNRY
jgi:hypothetical protein